MVQTSLSRHANIERVHDGRQTNRYVNAIPSSDAGCREGQHPEDLELIRDTEHAALLWVDDLVSTKPKMFSIR